MKRNGFNLYRVAVEKYSKEAQEARKRNDKEALKEARWRMEYFKDKIRKRKIKND